LEPGQRAPWGRTDDDLFVRADLAREPVGRVAVGDDDVLLRSLEPPERADEPEDELLDPAGLASRTELRVDRHSEWATV
jgi:hypothetical protein